VSSEIENQDTTHTFLLLEDTLKTESFRNFWSKINKKTYYDITFDETEFIQKSIEEINNNLEEYHINQQYISV
jgi:type III restriction enzyme